MHLLTLVLAALVFLNSSVQGAEYKLSGTFHVAVKDPSGLIYDPIHDSLWTVRDHGSGLAEKLIGGGGGLFEIDKKGKVLKKMPLKASNDLEGIAYRADTDTFLLAEERRREVVEIDRAGKALRTIKVPIKWGYRDLNHGIEGVAYDPRSKSIFVANEKYPTQVMELTEDGNIVNSFEVIEASNISDLYYDATTDRLLVLSHENILLEFTRKGQLIKTFPVEADRAEGITKDSRGYLYIICEATSTLYVYAPEVIPTSAPVPVTPQAATEKAVNKGTPQRAPTKPKSAGSKK
ncbi:MAG: SdiA-regulated domain-containing protein [Candidatus Brocadiaceae bacterium]|nr:SdiA-regulated domain-containing protein [Candidatus Brocadiaceae bacterium]